MPITFRIMLDGPTPASPFQHMAGLRALVLDWFRRADPETSAVLHDTNARKPYTVSALWPESPEPHRAQGNLTPTLSLERRGGKDDLTPALSLERSGGSGHWFEVGLL